MTVTGRRRLWRLLVGSHPFHADVTSSLANLSISENLQSYFDALFMSDPNEIYVSAAENDFPGSCDKSGPLHVFSLPGNLFKDEVVHGSKSHLVLTPQARACWQRIADKLFLCEIPLWDKAVLIGTPGVGKSRGIIYLIRLLVHGVKQQQHKWTAANPPPSIVFESRKTDISIFLRPRLLDGDWHYDAFELVGSAQDKLSHVVYGDPPNFHFHIITCDFYLH